MMPEPQTNANLVGQTLQVGPAAGAIGALANANVLFDWVEIITTGKHFAMTSPTRAHDLATDGVLPGGIWTGVVNAGAGGFSSRVAPNPGRCITCTWNVNGSGNFNVATNYTGDSPGLAFPPSGNDTTVVFGPALATGTATVYTNTNVPIKELRFDNVNTYNLAGAGAITLDSNSGNALINVLQGNHEIQADLILNDDVTATAAAGTSLNINAPVYLNGRTFTVAAGSTINLNNGRIAGSPAGAGSLVNEGNSADYPVSRAIWYSRPAAAWRWMSVDYRFK